MCKEEVVKIKNSTLVDNYLILNVLKVEIRHIFTNM